MIIHKNAQGYYCFISSDDKLYRDAKKEISNNGNQIIWERENVTIEQLENARKTKEEIVKKLNGGEETNVKRELSPFFK